MKPTCNIRINSSKVECINPIHSQKNFNIYFCQDVFNVSQDVLLGIDKYILDSKTSIF